MSRRLLRAALFGLGAALAIAAFALVFNAWTLTKVDCTHLLPEECTFERETSGQLARTQALEAVGFALVSAGLFVWLKPARRKLTET